MFQHFILVCLTVLQSIKQSLWPVKYPEVPQVYTEPLAGVIGDGDALTCKTGKIPNYPIFDFAIERQFCDNGVDGDAGKGLVARRSPSRPPGSRFKQASVRAGETRGVELGNRRNLASRIWENRNKMGFQGPGFEIEASPSHTRLDQKSVIPMEISAQENSNTGDKNLERRKFKQAPISGWEG